MRLTVRSGTGQRVTPSARPRARRLRLTADQFSVLMSAAPGAVPPLFADFGTQGSFAGALRPDREDRGPAAGTDGRLADPAVEAAVQSEAPGEEDRETGVWQQLVELGVAQESGRGDERLGPVPAVAITLAVLTTAPVALELVAGGSTGRVVAWWSLDGRHGVGLIGTSDGGVELSAFLASHWQAEVTRAVPAAEVFSRGSISGSVAAGLSASLSGEPAEPVGKRAHRVSLRALQELARPGGPVPSSDEVAPQLSAVLSRPAGQLDARVWVRTTAGPATGGVSWIAAPGGWLSLRADPRSGRGDAPPMVDVLPVQPADLAGELAPLLLAGVTRYAQATAPGSASGDTADGGPDEAREMGTESAPTGREPSDRSPTAVHGEQRSDAAYGHTGDEPA
jgi:hypothetical protein